MAFCTACGRDIGSARYCSNCGAAASGAGDIVPQTNAVPVRPYPTMAPDAYAGVQDDAEGIRRNLERFSTYQQNVTCPRCGYHGPVGFVREAKPFYASCLFLALLFITVVGIVAILLLAILGKLKSSSEVCCPRCGFTFLNRA